LPEVQQVCDRVGIIREGRLVKTERVETLTHQQFKRINLTLRQAPPADAFALDGVAEKARTVVGDTQVIALEVRQGIDRVMETALAYGIADIEMPPVTLDEIFLAFYDRQRNGGYHG
jgi:ABC-2 type transport system ATP-binding protein